VVAPRLISRCSSLLLLPEWFSASVPVAPGLAARYTFGEIGFKKGLAEFHSRHFYSATIAAKAFRAL